MPHPTMVELGLPQVDRLGDIKGATSAAPLNSHPSGDEETDILISKVKRRLEKSENVVDPRGHFLPLQEIRAATSIPEGFTSGGLQNSNGKKNVSSEIENSSNQSISDLIQAIKTDPEAKRLLVDAIAEDQSSASDSSVLTPVTSQSDEAHDISATNAKLPPSSRAGICGRANPNNCGGHCDQFHDTTVPDDSHLRQAANAGSVQVVNEFGNEARLAWECRAVDENANAQIRYSSSRFSGRRPVEVMVGGSVYYVHHSVYDRILSGGGYPERKTFTGIKCFNFEAILEFLYTDDTKHLAALDPKDLKEIETWAIENWSCTVLSGALQVGGADVLSAEILPHVARVYVASHNIHKFREYFRKTLKEELQYRLENGESTNQLLTEVVTQLQYAPLAFTDVTKALHDLWTTAASETAFKEQMRPCGCVGDEECSGCICEDDDYAPAGGSKDNDHDYSYQDDVSEDAASVKSTWRHRVYLSDDQPNKFQPDSPNAAHLAAFGQLANAASMPAWTNDNNPSPISPPNFHPPSPTPFTNAVAWDNAVPPPPLAVPKDRPINAAHADLKAAALQGTSALARCVYHRLWPEVATTDFDVAEGLGCDANEAKAAFDELVNVGLVRNVGNAWGGSKYSKLTEVTIPATADECRNDTWDAQPHGTRSALDTTSALARCIHHYLDKQVDDCGHIWLQCPAVTDNTGCTVLEAEAALDELLEAGVVEAKFSGWYDCVIWRAKALRTTG